MMNRPRGPFMQSSTFRLGLGGICFNRKDLHLVLGTLAQKLGISLCLLNLQTILSMKTFSYAPKRYKLTKTFIMLNKVRFMCIAVGALMQSVVLPNGATKNMILFFRKVYFGRAPYSKSVMNVFACLCFFCVQTPSHTCSV